MKVISIAQAEAFEYKTINDLPRLLKWLKKNGSNLDYVVEAVISRNDDGPDDYTLTIKNFGMEFAVEPGDFLVADVTGQVEFQVVNAEEFWLSFEVAP